MANMKAAFSGDNIKRFFLKHTEKLIFGLVCLFVLLTLVGTQWSTFQRTPAELEQNLQSAERMIATSVWTEEEKAKFPPVEVDEEVNQMLAGINPGPYALGTEVMFNPTGRDDPRREPEFVAVADVIAESGRTILAQSTDPVLPEEETSSAKPAVADAPVTPDAPDDLGLDDVADRSSIAPQIGDDMMGEENPYGAGGYYEEYTVSDSYDDMIMEDYSGEGGEMGMGLPSNVKGVPVRYVSVRGVFNLRRQVVNYSRALSIPETEAERLVEFLDFKLERQKADSPKGPWDGEWEPVDVEVALDYLNQTVDFDPDVVSSGVRNPVITMPLPARLIGVWRNKVNHPKVKNFELSPEEIEAEQALNRKILDEMAKKNQKIKQLATAKGFNRVQVDVTQLQQDYLMNTDARQLTKTFETEFKGTPKEVREKLIQKIKAQVTAAGNLVLFRYIDFDLEAGKSYRYRVSLVLRNPNYDQPIDQVVEPSVAMGQIRETPMSEASNVATVSPDYAYFVSRVSPPRGINNEMADMTVFQWYESGTMIKSNLTMEPGDFIGGTAKTHVLRPAELKYEQENVVFKTDDLMVDALVVDKLDYNLHSDLKLPNTLTRGDVGVTAEVLVVDADGKLNVLDPFSTAGTKKSYEDYYVAEKGPFDKIKDAANKRSSGMSELDALLGEGSGMDYEMEMMMEMDAGASRLRGRRRNPSRRGGAMSGSSSAMP